MLATNFIEAHALGISEVERDALIKVLGMLEREEIPEEEFDMIDLDRCICGWAFRVSGSRAFPYNVPWKGRSNALNELFCLAQPYGRNANTTQAAHALHNYLTTGDHHWFDVMQGIEAK